MTYRNHPRGMGRLIWILQRVLLAVILLGILVVITAATPELWL